MSSLARSHDPTPLDDAPLLAAIARDDLGALGILYDRHAAAVGRVVHRVLGGANDVDDVVHATFLKVPRIAASFDGRPSARSWLIGIAVRTALKHTRGLGRFRRMLGSFAHVTRQADHMDPEARTVARTQIERLECALAQLPNEKRMVFVLVEMEGLPHEDVARALRIPTATVRTRLFHAKRELLRAVRGEDDE